MHSHLVFFHRGIPEKPPGLFKVQVRDVYRRGRREHRGITQILLSESGRDNQKKSTLYPGVPGGLGGSPGRD